MGRNENNKLKGSDLGIVNSVNWVERDLFCLQFFMVVTEGVMIHVKEPGCLAFITNSHF